MAEGTVEFANVTYTLPSTTRTLLHDISLILAPGTTTALLGRSGSGKTTLMRMINGLVQPTSGKVVVSGQTVCTANLIELRRGIGYCIQETGLFPHWTVERNVGIALELGGKPKPEIAAQVQESLTLAGIPFEEFRARYPWQLSGGQRQRVGLARALAMRASILLMDEPFGALDPLTRAEMQTMLRDLLVKVSKTVLLVTHDLDEALYLAERIIFLEAGSVVADLPAKEVLASQIPAVSAYVAAVHRAVPA